MKLNYLFIPYLVVLAFMFGGILNSGGISWYKTLVLPSWSPPEIVISLVWALIYVGAGWSLFLVWNNLSHDRRFTWIMGGFAVSTVVNFAWSIIFFDLHLLSAAVWCALLLGFLVLGLIVLIFPRSRKAALLLAPYTVWVFFAAYLNYVVWTLNG